MDEGTPRNIDKCITFGYALAIGTYSHILQNIGILPRYGGRGSSSSTVNIPILFLIISFHLHSFFSFNYFLNR